MSQTFDLNQALVLLLDHTDLSADQMEQVTREFMSGETDDALMAAILTALRMKGESYGEITGGARAMRALSTTIQLNSPQVIDIVGTGGDGQSLFNVSTACSFVVAAAGMTVAKHGNRGVKCRRVQKSHAKSIDGASELFGCHVQSDTSSIKKVGAA